MNMEESTACDLDATLTHQTITAYSTPNNRLPTAVNYGTVVKKAKNTRIEEGDVALYRIKLESVTRVLGKMEELMKRVNTNKTNGMIISVIINWTFLSNRRDLSQKILI